ncbi:MAG: 50S ribosome-binding GTPase [Propionibacteriaceae bacterium]|nr:50S ribosome-binding GTPase [Propionibacteriaceae bacterium]
MPSLEEDLALLVAAVDACRGRVDVDVLGQAENVIDRVDRRLSLSRNTTVIALIGATGSGKSSLFNALTRTALAEPGISRPMTQHAMAVTFGDTDTSALLEWLGIQRHYSLVSRDLDSVVLLDLVDNDSVSPGHKQEVDRLLDVVDEFFWVVDPQKYADALLHERYIQRLTSHTEVMAFVLNQIDRLPPEQVNEIHQDLVRLLKDDGVDDPTVFEVSALTGQGIGAVRHHMSEVASSKHSMVRRREADILVQAKALADQVGTEPAGALGKNHLATIANACMEVVGAKQIGEAVLAGVTRRGRVATGWPWLSWITHFRVDPLKRLHLDQFRSSGSHDDEPDLLRSSAVVHPVARARIDTAIRAVGDDARARLPHQWRTVLDALIKEQAASLPTAIDQAVVTTDLGIDEGHGWWTGVRVLQWVVFAITVIGLGWLAVDLVLRAFFQVPSVPMLKLGVLPLPTWLVIIGAFIGLVIASVSRMAVVMGAKATATKAVSHLRRAMEKVASDKVITPINSELQRHDTAQDLLRQVLS